MLNKNNEELCLDTFKIYPTIMFRIVNEDPEFVKVGINAWKNEKKNKKIKEKRVCYLNKVESLFAEKTS